MAVFVDVWLLFMLINTSSIFEFNMLVAAAIMFTILELILEIMPNNPTWVGGCCGAYHIPIIFKTRLIV